MNLNSIKYRFELFLRLFSVNSLSEFELVDEINSLDKLDEVAKYHASFNLLSKLAAKWGFQIYNRNLNWVDDNGFWEIWNSSPFLNQRPDRKYVAWSMAIATLGVEGDTVECGVLDGATSYLICNAAKKLGIHKRHHAFDSWEGLSDVLPEDHTENKLNTFFWKKGDLSVSQETTMKNLAAFDSISYYKGWIPSRFKEVEEISFSFVHIDVDIYQPTRDSLEFFYPRMNPGGIILCDDYGYHTCPGAKKAFDDFMLDKIEGPVIHIPTGQGFIVKR